MGSYNSTQTTNLLGINILATSGSVIDLKQVYINLLKGSHLSLLTVAIKILLSGWHLSF